MTRLYICEKPSLAKVLAENLGSPIKKANYYEVNGDYVAWLKGHIIELIMPDDYKPEWERKACNYDVLPMIPDEFRKQVKSGFGYPDLYKGLKFLSSKADIIVNVGDPDREGQYLVDEVLDMLGWQGKTERLFINAYDDATVKKALKGIEDNRSDKNYNMYRSAFCRDITDWLIGMNGSRKFSLDAGYSVAVGRVQIPILALVYRRNKEIDNFKPVKYYKVKANNMAQNVSFVSEWKATEQEKQFGFDSEDRLINQDVGINIAGKVKGNDGILEKVVREHKKVSQPLPFNLATLQGAACAQLGISLKDLDEIMQSLYEKHKLLTYPRSDCEYIPESQFGDAPAILSMLASLSDTELSKMASGADSSICSRAFNTKKTTAHHAIIPTSVKPDFSKLTEGELGVYLIAAKRYVLQFYPLYEYDSTKFSIRCKDEIFEASGSVVTVSGWKQYSLRDDENDVKKDNDDNNCLPDIAEGSTIFFDDVKLVENITKPPKRFTQKDLIAALCNAHKFVKDKNLKEVIKNIKGLGTPATRSKIIEKLLERGTLIEQDSGKGKKKNKDLYTAPEVEELINALPDELTYPDQTALIELDLDKVASGEVSESEYVVKISAYIKGLMKIKGKFTPKEKPEDKNHPVCPVCGKGRLYLHEGKFGKFWSCSAYKEGCTASFDDNRGKPVIISCPECKKGFLRRRKSKAGNYFWSCSNYADGCKAFYYDNNGKPDIPPPPEKCPVCGKNLNQINTKKGKFWVCEDNKNGCKAPWFADVKGKPQIIKCPNCDGFLIKREGKNGPFFGCSNYDCKTFFSVDPKTGKPVKDKPKFKKK